jgi:hypothetical protein
MFTIVCKHAPSIVDMYKNDGVIRLLVSDFSNKY